MSSAGDMVPSKPRQFDRAAAAFDDDLSVIEPPAFGKMAKKQSRRPDVDREEAAKRAKLLASKKHKGMEVPPVRATKDSAPVVRKAKGPELGKTRFYRENVRVTLEMLDKQLLGFGRLDLSVKAGDYGEPCFYSGSNSSGDTDP